MYKKCEELLNKLQQQDKIQKSNFMFPEKQELKIRLKDMLEDSVEEKFYLKDEIVEKIKYKLDISENELLDNLQTNKMPIIKIKNATKQGYLEATVGDGINISSRMQVQRGNVQKDIIQTITTSGGNDRGVVVADRSPIVINPLKDKTPYGWHFEQNVYVPNGITRTIKAGGGSGNIPKVIEEKTINNVNEIPLRIRKLTPKECWRLMGFVDKDYDNAQKTNSASQLYKQAGNSICVSCLENIFQDLLINEQN